MPRCIISHRAGQNRLINSDKCIYLSRWSIRRVPWIRLPKYSTSCMPEFCASFPNSLIELGGDPKLLMQQVGIHPEQHSQGKSGATYRQMVHLIELAAAEAAMPRLRHAPGDTSERRRNVWSVGTGHEELEDLRRRARLRQQTHLCTQSGGPHLAEAVPVPAKTVFVGHDILLDRMPNKSQAMEQILLVGHLAAAEITGGHARVREGPFPSPTRVPLRIYRRYFGCEVRFGQNEDGVVFSERDLACPIIDPDFAGLPERPPHSSMRNSPDTGPRCMRKHAA